MANCLPSAFPPNSEPNPKPALRDYGLRKFAVGKNARRLIGEMMKKVEAIREPNLAVWIDLDREERLKITQGLVLSLLGLHDIERLKATAELLRRSLQLDAQFGESPSQADTAVVRKARMAVIRDTLQESIDDLIQRRILGSESESFYETDWKGGLQIDSRGEVDGAGDCEETLKLEKAVREVNEIVGRRIGEGRRAGSIGVPDLIRVKELCVDVFEALRCRLVRELQVQELMKAEEPEEDGESAGDWVFADCDYDYKQKGAQDGRSLRWRDKIQNAIVRTVRNKIKQVKRNVLGFI